MYPRHPEHLKAFDYVGPYAYFLTFCTNHRHLAFVQRDRVDLVKSHILRAAADERFAITAYCYMPDHVHLLVEGTAEDSDLRRFIKLAKQLSGFHYQQAFGRKLWQRYGFEHVLRGSESSLSVARYIIENPLRAGLARSVYEYPFVGSETYNLKAIAEAVLMKVSWHRRSG
jgi:putative transposase